MPLPRFRIRTLMIAAAVVAVEMVVLDDASTSSHNHASAFVVVATANLLAIWGGLFMGAILWSLVYITRRR